MLSASDLISRQDLFTHLTIHILSRFSLIEQTLRGKKQSVAVRKIRQFNDSFDDFVQEAFENEHVTGDKRLVTGGAPHALRRVTMLLGELVGVLGNVHETLSSQSVSLNQTVLDWCMGDIETVMEKLEGFIHEFRLDPSQKVSLPEDTFDVEKYLDLVWGMDVL